MKTKTGIFAFILTALFFVPDLGLAQDREMQFFRPNDKRGLNVFEPGKADTVPFTGMKVQVGGDFAIQFQGLDHSNKMGNLVDLDKNLNLPTANLNLDVQLFDGMRLHLRTYLSSRHHSEAWVKGGHLRIDKLDFIKPGFLSGVMEHVSITVGLDEFNYGDAHFRRSDNARAIFNPFVGNYIMDSFSTEPFAEVTVTKSGFLGVVGLTNGKLNQNVVLPASNDNEVSFYGKLGYDSGEQNDFRWRLTGSVYTNQGKTTGHWLYGGDRAGSRYYGILTEEEGTPGDFEGRFNPAFNRMTAVQINPFVKYHGVEFFGIYELVSNASSSGGGSFSQYGAELLYRFGNTEQLYVGGRYNMVTGKATSDGDEFGIDRYNLGAGWYMTKNVLAKVEYMQQTYNDWAPGTKYEGAEFSGVNIEAVISF